MFYWLGTVRLEQTDASSHKFHNNVLLPQKYVSMSMKTALSNRLAEMKNNVADNYSPCCSPVQFMLWTQETILSERNLSDENWDATMFCELRSRGTPEAHCYVFI